MLELSTQWRVCVVVILASLGCLTGCNSDTEPSGETTPTVAATAKKSPEQLLELANKQRKEKQFEDAMSTLYKLFIESPDDINAKLLAAEIELARENRESALEFLSTIQAKSRIGTRAIELRVKTLQDLKRYNEAADVLLAALQQRENREWRHRAWEFLNRSGRREEASRQALRLCQLGLATDKELLSLINRRTCFPTAEMLEKTKQDGDQFFTDGLGKARWLFDSGKTQAAIETLSAQFDTEFESKAADAFYGRLLAESQNWDQLRQWNARTDDQVKQFGDYWAAIGAFFIDQHQFEGAARALLEAVRRDPTDRVSVQRLSKVFAALKRPDDGKQFQFRGIEIMHSEENAKLLYINPNNLEVRKTLAKKIMALERPFETLAWAESMLPSTAAEAKQKIAAQRKGLQRDPQALAMALESAMLGVNPKLFELKDAWKELAKTSANTKSAGSVSRQPIAAKPKLVNRANELGLDFQWYKDIENDFASIPIHESVGGGIAVIDFDLDGWSDVYVAQGSGDPPTDQCTRSNQLFRHLHQQFESVTGQASATDTNYSSGLASGDVNQDGFPDLYLGSLGHNRLLINNGDGTFSDATATINDGSDRFSTSLAIADINGDALPDLYESNYVEMEGGFALPKKNADGVLTAPTPLSHYAGPDRWFENLGDGLFQVHNIERQVAKPGTSLGVVVTDFLSNGKNEVFIGNDVRPNHFLVQSENNEFVNGADTNGLANGHDGAPKGCMGIATGDFNRDGRFDIQIANYSLEPANLYLQTESGNYVDRAFRFGLDGPTLPLVGFGTKAVDVDRNGFLDFIVTNGHIFDMSSQDGAPFRMPPQLLMSDGTRVEPTEVDDPSGYWSEKYLGRCLALMDYDKDGAMDYLIGHLDAPLALLHDQTNPSGGWLQIELCGTTSERDCIGAKVTATIDSQQYTQWVTAGDGYFCSDEPVVFFGFLEESDHGSVQIDWPSGDTTHLESINLGRRYLVVEGQKNAWQR